MSRPVYVVSRIDLRKPGHSAFVIEGPGGQLVGRRFSTSDAVIAEETCAALNADYAAGRRFEREIVSGAVVDALLQAAIVARDALRTVLRDNHELHRRSFNFDEEHSDDLKMLNEAIAHAEANHPKKGD